MKSADSTTQHCATVLIRPCCPAFALRRRRGYSTIEGIAAASVLGTLLLFLVPVLTSLRQSDATSSRKALALREVRNLVEQLQPVEIPVLPELPQRVSDDLPEAKAELQSQADSASESALPMTRHTIILSWREKNGLRSVQLSWWKPARGKEAT